MTGQVAFWVAVPVVLYLVCRGIAGAQRRRASWGDHVRNLRQPGPRGGAPRR